MFNPDLAKYPDLRAIAQWINRFCVHAQGMANMQGLGGIMTAGVFRFPPLSECRQ